jgi:predicted phage baseplate assembly protein
VQIETLPALKLGQALGLPDLELQLGAGALPEQKTAPNPLRIRTLEPGGPIEWRHVDDLARSGPEDRDYVLDEALGTIRFGNGVNGLRPPGGQIDRDALDITAGAQGNLAVGVAWGIDGLPSGAASWMNREPMSGGCDAWDREMLLAELRRRSCRRLAMLTDAELRDAATRLQGFGLERAEVLPRFLPTLPHRSVPGARTLLLHPGEGVQGSDAWVAEIERRLAPRRVLGERLSLTAAEPVTIAVAADLLIASGSDAPTIKEAVRTVLQARLSAFRKSPTIEPWPSGRPVTIGELEALVAGVAGGGAGPRLRVGGRGDPPGQMSVPLARTEVAVAGAIELALLVEA